MQQLLAGLAVAAPFALGVVACGGRLFRQLTDLPVLKERKRQSGLHVREDGRRRFGLELAGRTAGHGRRFKDAAALRRRDGRWGVVLPATFGQKAG